MAAQGIANESEIVGALDGYDFVVIDWLAPLRHSRCRLIEAPSGHSSTLISPDSLSPASTNGAEACQRISFVDDTLSTSTPPAILSLPAFDRV